jgi:hypothetical protein
VTGHRGSGHRDRGQRYIWVAWVYSHRAFSPSLVEKIRWRGYKVKEKRDRHVASPSVQ